MKKNRAQKDILYISISSFVLVALWVGFNIYHQSVDTTISPELQVQIESIEPNFDIETIEKLKQREKINPAYVAETASNEAVLAPASPTPIQQEVSSPSGSIQLLGE